MKAKTKSGLIEHPKPIRKQVYEHLRDQVLNHPNHSSDRLVEAKIAKELGISRTPVREALHLLEKDGFVESIPRVGYSIKKLTIDELDEIFEMRMVNEKLACRWAVGKIKASGLKKMEKNIAGTEKILEKGTPHLFIDYDEEFHEILVQSSGSKHLFDLCQQLRQLMLRYRAASIKTAESVENALAGHKRIFEALKSRDQESLEAELARHLYYSREDIRKQAKTIKTENTRW